MACKFPRKAKAFGFLRTPAVCHISFYRCIKIPLPQTERRDLPYHLFNDKYRNTVIFQRCAERIVLDLRFGDGRFDVVHFARAYADLVDDGNIFVPERGDRGFLFAFKADKLRLHLLVFTGDIDDFQIDLAVVAHRSRLENTLIDLPDVFGKHFVPSAVFEDVRIEMLGRIAELENIAFGTVTKEFILLKIGQVIILVIFIMIILIHQIANLIIH